MDIDEIIEAGGGVTEIARNLGITKGAVSQWKKVPIIRVIQLEGLTGIPRFKLRPDIYPIPANQEAA